LLWIIVKRGLLFWGKNINCKYLKLSG
jgi:hypothetical protein